MKFLMSVETLKKKNNFHCSSNWAEATVFGKNMCLYMVRNDRAHRDKFKLFQDFKEIDNNVISEPHLFCLDL